MDWRKIFLPPSPSDVQEPSIFQYHLNEIYAEHGRPQGFCVYLTVHETGRTLYISPIAVELSGSFFREISGIHEFYECDAPIGGDVLVGVFGDCIPLLNRDR
jgi:hypothetical protein